MNPKSGRRVILRPFSTGDYQAWREANLNTLEKQNKYDSPKCRPQAISQTSFRVRVKRLRAKAKRDECYVYGVFNKKTGQHLGTVSLYLIMRQGLNWANLGYEIYNQFWRNGYATEAAKLMIEIGFRDLKIHRIEAAMELDHKGSIGIVNELSG